jgi:hypothetical protein
MKRLDISGDERLGAFHLNKQQPIARGDFETKQLNVVETWSACSSSTKRLLSELTKNANFCPEKP